MAEGVWEGARRLCLCAVSVPYVVFAVWYIARSPAVVGHAHTGRMPRKRADVQAVIVYVALALTR